MPTTHILLRKIIVQFVKNIYKLLVKNVQVPIDEITDLDERTEMIVTKK